MLGSKYTLSGGYRWEGLGLSGAKIRELGHSIHDFKEQKWWEFNNEVGGQ